MYESYWNLETHPFENSSDPRFFFAGEVHQASLLKLRYTIEHRKGIGLLVGGVGCGKTFLSNVLAQQLPSHVGPLVKIVFPQMTAPELLGYLAVELGGDEVSTTDTHSLDRTVRLLQQLLARHAEQNQHPVLVIDEAHLIEDHRVFQALRLLLNFETPRGAECTLILCGQRDILNRLRRMPQIEERIGVKCLLRPFTQAETENYVVHRLQVAGGRHRIFEPDALQALYEFSGGSPRKINRLCDLALLVGYADELKKIGAAQIEAVAEELATVAVD